MSGYLIADEFPAEIAAGAAYVAGLDDEGRPVLVRLCLMQTFVDLLSATRVC
jgi:hypothetical protein